MEIAIHYDRCRLSGDDTAHDRGNRESLLDGCIDGDHRGQLGVSLQRRISGAVTVGGSISMGPTVDKTPTDDGREVPAARGAYMILGLHILVFCIATGVSGVPFFHFVLPRDLILHLLRREWIIIKRNMDIEAKPQTGIYSLYSSPA